MPRTTDRSTPSSFATQTTVRPPAEAWVWRDASSDDVIRDPRLAAAR